MDPPRARRLRKPDDAEIVEDRLDDVGDLLHVVPGRALRRVEIDHDVVRLFGIVSAREPRMDLDRGVVRHPHERGHVVREDVGILRLAWIRPALDPLGRETGLVLLIEVRAVNPVGERLQGERPIPEPWHQERRDLGVVADQISLGVAVFGKQHLLEIGELDALALDFEDRGHARRLLAVLRCAARGRGALGGLLSFSRRLAPLLPRRVARIDIRAEATVGRMPERPVASDLGVLDLADELRQAPSRRLIGTRLRGERRRGRFVLFQDLQEIAQRSLVEPRTDVPNGLQLAVAIDADEQRAECLGATALARRPPADHTFHRAEGLDLHPRRRPRPR